MDVAADGFGGKRRKRAFFDIQVFNPHALSNRQSSLSATYKKYKQEKKRQYLQCICDVENTSSSSMVSTIFYKCLASLLAKKWDQPYSTTMDWL